MERDGRQVRLVAAAAVLALAHSVATAQTLATRQGVEYGLSRGLAADQTRPSLSLGGQGGYAAWQDNGVDGDGLGIGAVLLNGSLSPVSTRLFRVNQNGTGEQENPSVQMLADGGAVFVWQGGKIGDRDIWLRRLGANGVFTTGDVRVNTWSPGEQTAPQVGLMKDGSVLVTWNSFGQDGHLQGVFAQRLSPSGERLGPEVQVNQFTGYNQRSPALTVLEDGTAVIAWVTEQQRFENSVDIYARRLAADGSVLGGEFRLNTEDNLCANPTLGPGWGGGFLAAWSERDLRVVTNMWDIVAGTYDISGLQAGFVGRLNTHTAHNQFAPRVAALGGSRLVVWSSLWQDGSRDGVYGRMITDSGPVGQDIQLHTTTASRQIEPAVAADGAGRFLVAWSGFVGGTASFEILAQRFSGEEVLPAPAAPLVTALDSYSLMVSWEPLAGYPGLASYRLYLDGATTPVAVEANYHVVNDLDPGSTHSVRLAYGLSDGRVSPLSPTATGRTWGRDRNHDGLPDDWQAGLWGADAAAWPSPTLDSDGDGASNLAEFLAGTDPTVAASALRLTIAPTMGGLLVEWNAVAGSIYQLQSSADLKTWVDAAEPSFAAEERTASLIPSSNPTAYYRVVRIR